MRTRWWHRAMVGRLLRLVESEGPLFVEEPVLSEYPEAVKKVSGLTGCPVALGERLYSRWDFKRFFEGEFSCYVGLWLVMGVT